MRGPPVAAELGHSRRAIGCCPGLGLVRGEADPVQQERPTLEEHALAARSSGCSPLENREQSLTEPRLIVTFRLSLEPATLEHPRAPAGAQRWPARVRLPLREGADLRVGRRPRNPPPLVARPPRRDQLLVGGDHQLHAAARAAPGQPESDQRSLTVRKFLGGLTRERGVAQPCCRVPKQGNLYERQHEGTYRQVDGMKAPRLKYRFEDSARNRGEEPRCSELDSQRARRPAKPLRQRADQLASRKA